MTASTMMDLPAPVSPVSAVRPPASLELGRVDDREVADLQVREHAQYSSPPERPLRPQCSFERSRRK